METSQEIPHCEWCGEIGGFEGIDGQALCGLCAGVAHGRSLGERQTAAQMLKLAAAAALDTGLSIDDVHAIVDNGDPAELPVVGELVGIPGLSELEDRHHEHGWLRWAGDAA